ncbi:MAG: hypothetical protein Unbinned15contig1001_11 [Prokaryotic dsDNA virus sp.]|nr:MAG: hypothetical protein Unbinned15contig1001_11 [Prokaryotic dsDNA virus sp.]|tara:strand:+ start:22313 stop:22558 length:246 start_codon:yes stop_codon:yes gene_type:complete
MSFDTFLFELEKGKQMSTKKVKFNIEIYEEITETHEVIVDEETYNKLGHEFSVYDYLSERTLMKKKLGANTDYKIIKKEVI